MTTTKDHGTNDLTALLGQYRRPAGRKRGLDPDLAEKRKKEAARRTTRAWTMAHRALAAKYPEDYEDLLAQAREFVADEEGPLPGDA